MERYLLRNQKYVDSRMCYRDQLSAFVNRILTDPQVLRRLYLNGCLAQRMATSQIHGYANYTMGIHKLLTMELMARQLIDL